MQQVRKIITDRYPSNPGIVPLATLDAEVVSAESVLIPIEIVLSCVLVDDKGTCNCRK